VNRLQSSAQSGEKVEIEMDEKQIKQHIPILGVLHLASGVLWAIIGVFIFLFLSGLGAAVHDPVAFRVLTVVGTVVGTLLVVLSVPGMVAGYGLLKQRSWARGLAIAVGFLSLFNVPIGTLIGIYTLFVLLQTDAGEYFVALKQA
jgi:hypothetical protein